MENPQKPSLTKLSEGCELVKRRVGEVQHFLSLLETKISADENYTKDLCSIVLKCQSFKGTEMPDFIFTNQQIRRMMKEQAIHFSSMAKQQSNSMSQAIKKLKVLEDGWKGLDQECKRLDRAMKKEHQQLKTLGDVFSKILKENDQKLFVSERSKQFPVLKLLNQQTDYEQKYREADFRFQQKIPQWMSVYAQCEEKINWLVKEAGIQHFDLLKNQSIFVVSLIRNLQYDIDSTIRRVQQAELGIAYPPILVQKEIPNQFQFSNPWSKERKRIYLEQAQQIETLPFQNILEATSQTINSINPNLLPKLQQRFVSSTKEIPNKSDVQYENLYLIAKALVAKLSQQKKVIKPSFLKQLLAQQQVQGKRKVLFERLKEEALWKDMTMWKLLLREQSKGASTMGEQPLFKWLLQLWMLMWECQTDRPQAKSMVVKLGRSLGLRKESLSELIDSIEQIQTPKRRR